MAKAEEMSDAARNAFSSLTESDFVYPSFLDDQGNSHQLSGSNFSMLLDSPNRSVRKGAFDAMMGQFGQFNNTLSSTYASNVKADMFKRNARGFARLPRDGSVRHQRAGQCV